MTEREEIARALCRAIVPGERWTALPMLIQANYFNTADAVLAALGLNDGGENVVVPREPTEAMLRAAWEATRTASATDRIKAHLSPPREAHDFKMCNRYRAMLTARPEVET